jgi:pyridoxal phosphate enzyme (YggS family)
MVKDNIAKIKERIPGHITIVAVSKNRTPEEIKEAVEAGITDIGENKVQEAISKIYELRVTGYELRKIKWHMVGHLQTNKAKEAVKIFDLIQSVDSLRLAQEIDKQAAKINKIQDILIEVKTSPEATKSGLKPDEAIEVIEKIAQLKNLRVKGLMTIALVVDNPEKARPCFRMLRELRDKINRLGTMNHELRTLSMGMTDDFKVAIEEGADMVRLGRAIFVP